MPTACGAIRATRTRRRDDVRGACHAGQARSGRAGTQGYKSDGRVCGPGYRIFRLPLGTSPRAGAKFRHDRCSAPLSCQPNAKRESRYPELQVAPEALGTGYFAYLSEQVRGQARNSGMTDAAHPCHAGRTRSGRAGTQGYKSNGRACGPGYRIFRLPLGTSPRAGAKFRHDRCGASRYPGSRTPRLHVALGPGYCALRNSGMTK